MYKCMRPKEDPSNKPQQEKEQEEAASPGPSEVDFDFDFGFEMPPSVHALDQVNVCERQRRFVLTKAVYRVSG